MKLAFSLVVLLACAALNEAAPARPGGIRDHIKGLIDVFKGQALSKIEELREQKERLMDKLREAKGVAEEDIKKKIDEISNDMKNTYEELLKKLKKIFSNDDENTDYFKDALLEKIRELREKMTSKATEIAEILKGIAEQSGRDAKEHLRRQRDVIMKDLQRLRYELLSKLIELLRKEQNEKDQQETQYGIKSDVLETLRIKVAEIRKKLVEVHDQLRTEVGKNRDNLLIVLRELQEEMKGCMNDIIAAVKHMMGRKTSDPIEDENSVYIVDSFRELRRQINMKLDALKSLVDLAKIATGQATEEIKGAIEVLRKEIPLLRDELIREIKKMFQNAEQV